MFTRTLDEIDESDIQALVADKAPESMTLEFKRQLNITSKVEKEEAAKDVSAMANTAGGRILYGIDEAEQPDGLVVADKIAPLQDAAQQSRLENALVEAIHPRPRFRIRPVRVSDGFVLVVEVFPSFPNDLHMVSGYKNLRFYRRNDQRTTPMTEPEIRDAYCRIATSRQSLEASIKHAIREELAFAQGCDEHVIIAPWFGRFDQINPRHFGKDFGYNLSNHQLYWSLFQDCATNLKVCAGGYKTPPGNSQYASVRRNGLIHFAKQSLNHMADFAGNVLKPMDTVRLLVCAFVAAQFILDKAAYWGPVRVLHNICAPSGFRLLRGKSLRDATLLDLSSQQIPPGTYQHVFPEVWLGEYAQGYCGLLNDFLDRLFQTAGDESCPWFDEARVIKPEISNWFNDEPFTHDRLQG